MKELSNHVVTKTECIIHDAYREIYSTSKPRGNWDFLIKEYFNSGKKFWEEHFLSRKRREEITLKHLKRHDCTDKAVVNYVVKFINTNY